MIEENNNDNMSMERFFFLEKTKFMIITYNFLAVCGFGSRIKNILR